MGLARDNGWVSEKKVSNVWETRWDNSYYGRMWGTLRRKEKLWVDGAMGGNMECEALVPKQRLKGSGRFGYVFGKRE